MALFEPGSAERAAAQPLIDWLTTAPPADVAVEVLAAFAAAGDVPVTRDKLQEWLFRDHPKTYSGGLMTVNTAASHPVAGPVQEALQLLEHSELIMYESWFDQNYPQLAWLLTRLGRDTLAHGKAAVRQRIAERTGL
ncbi:hypothetical protein FK535_09435 [Mycolicibacterium sp. 018/SC-01/001]|uniref:hypothetical protein n=1 Tax=Mycolicibacterium sp. 018/SC-01/001 TaxID=2592069 RepID=UPI00117F7C28|nr:hypothetical protein [Mycolicibacterium sp. 018/SC-01/001]TRW84710.1 hypothetical protein FK535_09435 [Mycolicibacterium sp. 018/SC-01/001]